MLADLPEHSPLGASGASRWMKCPGSVSLSTGVHDEESDFAALGTAAHTLGEHCLTYGTEPWTHIGCPIVDGVLDGSGDNIPEDAPRVDKDMADAVQLYLDTLNQWHPERHQGNTWVEREFYCPSIHPLFYGRADFVHLAEDDDVLHIWDYKHGAGIVVEAKNNPQGMYYAAGVLEDLDLWDAVGSVVIHIMQPRGWHMDGPHRYWSIRTENLIEWVEDTLVPAMHTAEVSRDTKSGEHCRFCPARSQACPQLMGDMEELRIMTKRISRNEKGAEALSDEQLARYLDLFDVAKIVAKAAEKTTFNRLSAGRTIAGRKLAKGRANREWKKGAEKAAKKQFGKQAYNPVQLKSPAQVEAMPEGKAFAVRWAHKPDKGLTVVKADDARPAVSKDTKSLFKGETAKRKKK